MPMRKLWICALVFIAILLLGAKLNDKVLQREAAYFHRLAPYSVDPFRSISGIEIDTDTEYGKLMPYNPREYVKIISVQMP